MQRLKLFTQNSLTKIDQLFNIPKHPHSEFIITVRMFFRNRTLQNPAVQVYDRLHALSQYEYSI